MEGDKDAKWRLYRDRTGARTWSVWIHKGDLLRLVAALRCEYVRKGVADIAANAAQPAAEADGSDDESDAGDKRDADSDADMDSPGGTTDQTQGSQSSSKGDDSCASSSTARVSGNSKLQWGMVKSQWVGVNTDRKGEKHTIVKAVSKFDSQGNYRCAQEFATLKAIAKDEMIERMAKIS